MMAQPDESNAISTCGEAANAEEDSTAGSSVDSKRVTQVQNDGLLRGTQLDVSIWSALDDDLLEKIIARLPVKYLVQASSLSKTWRLRVLSESFRSEVQSSTVPRECYAPLLVNDRQELVGYESSSKRWCRLPTLSYVDEDLVKHWRLRAGDGPLLCWMNDKFRVHFSAHVFHVHVTNPVTKSWKQLTSRPKMNYSQLVHVVSWNGGKAYKVILGDMIPNFSSVGLFLELQIFDSADGSWTLDSYNEGQDIYSNLCGSVFINGVLHMLVTVAEFQGYKLISFDVNKRIWKEIPYLREFIGESGRPFIGDGQPVYFVESRRPYQALSFPYEGFSFRDVLCSQLVVCGSNVMLVVENTHFSSCWDETFTETVSLFRLDVESGLAFRVSKSPTKVLCHKEDGICGKAGHGDCFYMGCRLSSCPSTFGYNVRTQKWQLVNSVVDILPSFISSGDTYRDTNFLFDWYWTPFAYQPGLDPVLEV